RIPICVKVGEGVRHSETASFVEPFIGRVCELAFAIVLKSIHTAEVTDQDQVQITVAIKINQGRAVHTTKTFSTETRAFSRDRKSTRLNSSHQIISYAVFCLKK